MHIVSATSVTIHLVSKDTVAFCSYIAKGAKTYAVSCCRDRYWFYAY